MYVCMYVCLLKNFEANSLYMSRGKDVFVFALHALSIMFAMPCDHHRQQLPVISIRCCFDFTTD